LSESLNCNEHVYRHFLFFKNFHVSKKPLVICEGKTDNIYLECAIKRLADAHPSLAKKKDTGSIDLKISFLKRSKTTKRILGLAGGAGEFNNFIAMFRRERNHITVPGKKKPVIILIDNDNGAKKIYSFIKGITKAPVDPKSQYIFVTDNLYVVPTPLTDDGKDTTIEDFFEVGLKKTKLEGKTFNPSDKGFKNKTEYGKYLFSKLIVKKNQATIDFSGFNPILERIEAVLEDYKRRLA
jgi:RNA-directed DNA polymerase